MKNLQRKAHVSLQEFREGRQSPLTGVAPYRSFAEGTPELEEDDELSKLGGRTRLISQKDLSKSPSPQVVTRSPNTHNPIVPLPLPDATMGVHPTVVEYLSTFNFGATGREAGQMYGSAQDQTMYGPAPGSAGGPFNMTNGSGSGAMHFHPNVELHTQTHNLGSAAADAMQAQTSPSSAGSSGLHSMVGTSPQHSPVHTRGQQHVPHPAHAHHHQHQQQQQASQSQQQQQQQSQQQYFPQYFPVFDYGTASAGANGAQGAYGQMSSLAGPSGANGALGAGYDGHAMAYEPTPGPERATFVNTVGLNGAHDRRESLTPDGGMHSHAAWADFVSHLSMNM